MVMKGYSIFPNAPVLREPHHQIVKCYIQDTCREESYLSTKMKSVYSTTPADLAKSAWSIQVNMIGYIKAILFISGIALVLIAVN